MRKLLFIIPAFLLVIATSLWAQPEQVKVVLSPASTIPKADLVKDFQRCSSVSIILDSTKSDYMLEAVGWSGAYKFTVFKKGGEAVFSTSTRMLSNAVKDVCVYVTKQHNETSTAMHAQ